MPELILFPRVLAHVEGKMVKPTPERPFEGQITIHSEISPMASSEYEAGRWVRLNLRFHSLFDLISDHQKKK